MTKVEAALRFAGKDPRSVVATRRWFVSGGWPEQYITALGQGTKRWVYTPSSGFAVAGATANGELFGSDPYACRFLAR